MVDLTPARRAPPPPPTPPSGLQPDVWTPLLLVHEGARPGFEVASTIRELANHKGATPGQTRRTGCEAPREAVDQLRRQPRCVAADPDASTRQTGLDRLDQGKNDGLDIQSPHGKRQFGGRL